MAPRRRRLLELAGTSILTVIAGCSAGGSVNKETTITDQPAIEVRLKGPKTNLHLFGKAAVRTVGELKKRNHSYTFKITLTDEVASKISETFRAKSVHKEPDKFELIIQDDRKITQFGIAPGLAKKIAGENWDGTFKLTFDQQENAKEVQEALACEAKSAPVACKAS